MNRCFIIGGGPSINDVNFDLIKHEFCIGINEAFRLGTFINTWFFADSDIFREHRQDIEKWPNRIVSCAGAAKRHKKIEYLERCREHVLCFEPKKIGFPSRGANSGASAINLAVREGFEEIILLGYDMKLDGEKSNYHDYYKKQTQQQTYDKFKEVFEAIAKEIKATVINANPDSALECFPKCELKDLL